MKKILTIACLIAAFNATAQPLVGAEQTQAAGAFTMRSSLAEKPNTAYLTLTIASKKTDEGIEIFKGAVDVGDQYAWMLADSSGLRPMRFNSPMDIFNYLHGQGWEFVNTAEDTRTTALWAKLLFDVTTVRTRIVYIFKRQKR